MLNIVKIFYQRKFNATEYPIVETFESDRDWRDYCVDRSCVPQKAIAQIIEHQFLR